MKKIAILKFVKLTLKTLQVNAKAKIYSKPQERSLIQQMHMKNFQKLMQRQSKNLPKQNKANKAVMNLKLLLKILKTLELVMRA